MSLTKEMLCFIFIFVFSMAFSAYAASQPNETLLKELREMDKALNSAFKEAQGRLDEKGRQALRKEQLEWMKLRDSRCGSAFKARNMEEWLQNDARDEDRAFCVIRHLEKRINWLSGKKPPAGGGESIRFDSEAKKLDFIRAALVREKHVKPSEDNAPFCAVMLEEFSAGKGFMAIEPNLRADSPYDPRFWKWYDCEGKDYKDAGVDVERFYDGLEWLGAPPYRYYRIELDGSLKNGPEDLIYHEHPIDQTPGDSGYSWVDTKKCEFKGGFSVMGASSKWSKKTDAVYLNLLTRYKHRVWAVEYIEKSILDLSSGAGREEPKKGCLWHLNQ